MAGQEGSPLLKLLLSCLLAWTGPTSVVSESHESHEEAQAEEYVQLPSELLGQRLLLWFLTLAGFYGLVWILDDFTGERCSPPRAKEAASRDCRIPAQDPSPSRRHCNMQSSLRSLGKTEQDLVTLLYKLRKHKVALATGWFQRDRRCRQAPLPNDLVIYTIQDET